jgi:type II secretory pathway predicted ATPase ExeA
MLEYGMLSQAGFIVISGEVGIGKTTIVRRYLRNPGKDVAVGVITNSSKNLGRMMDWVVTAYGIENRSQDPVELYNVFIEFLIARYAEGKRTVLIIDEAQNLEREMLEDLRMLSNVNNERDQILQIVLVGQPELIDTLKRHDLRQFVQRIAVHCHIEPLSPDETVRYIRHRLGVVGGVPQLFEDRACFAVHYFTNGIPRLINLLCDLSLVYGFSDDRACIDWQTVVEVVEDRCHGGLSAFQKLPADRVALEAAIIALEAASKR